MFIAIHPATYRGGGFLAHGVLNFFFFYRNSEYFCNQDSFVVFIPFVNSDDFHSKYSILTVEFLCIIFEVKEFQKFTEPEIRIHIKPWCLKQIFVIQMLVWRTAMKAPRLPYQEVQNIFHCIFTIESCKI